jgi:glutathione S-transferase
MYTTGVLEPSLTAKARGWEYTPSQTAWGSFDDMMARLRAAVERPYVLGDHFSAADILIGGGIQYALAFGMLPKEPAFEHYAARLAARPAFQRASAIDSGK